MADIIDGFTVTTNFFYSSGSIRDLLVGKNLSLDGTGGDYLGAATTGTYHDVNDDGQIYDASGAQTPENITYDAVPGGGSETSQFEYIGEVLDNYVLTFEKADGSTVEITSADLGSGSFLSINILANGRVTFDIADPFLNNFASTIGGDAQLLDIQFTDSLAVGDFVFDGLGAANVSFFNSKLPELDQFTINTNIVWNGTTPLQDQLVNTTVNVDGLSSGGDFVGETTTGYFIDDDANGWLADNTAIALPNGDTDGTPATYTEAGAEQYHVDDSGTLTGGTFLQSHVVQVTQGFNVVLKDGTVLTENELGQEMWFRILSDNSVVIDFGDSALTVIESYQSPIETITFDADLSTFSDYDLLLISGTDNALLIVCFAEGTLISTPSGTIPVDQLSCGDMVLTADGSAEPIRWIGARQLDQNDLLQYPKLRPIQIRAGALGRNIPRSDLVVSPQHRLLVQSRIAERMFGRQRVLIPAIKLLLLDGVEQVDVSSVTYWHFLCDRHVVVYANGAPAESLYLGRQSLLALPKEAREEINLLFPEVLEPDFLPSEANFIPRKGKKIKEMIKRHIKNNKPMINALIS